MDYQMKLDENDRKRLELENEYAAVEEELDNLEGSDDATIERAIELENKLRDINKKIITTYEESRLILDEAFENALEEVRNSLKQLREGKA